MSLEKIKSINFLPPELFVELFFFSGNVVKDVERRKKSSAIAIKLFGKLKVFLRVTRHTPKEKSRYIPEKILPSFILSQGTQHIIHVKNVRRLIENHKHLCYQMACDVPAAACPHFLH